MNLLEFKKFAELKKQGNYFIFDDPYGDGKYEIDGKIIDLSIEPIVLSIDPLSFEILFKAYQKTRAYMEFPSTVKIAADVKNSLNILSIFDMQTIKPMIIMFGSHSALQPYIDCLKVQHIEAQLVEKTDMSSNVVALRILSVLASAVEGQLDSESQVALLDILSVCVKELEGQVDLESLVRLVTIFELPFIDIYNRQVHYAKLNVAQSLPFNVEDKESATGVTAIVCYGIASTYLLCWDIFMKIKPQIRAAVESAQWAKLQDYENVNLDYLDEETLENLYLISY